MTEHYIETDAYLATVNAIAQRWNLVTDDVKLAMAEANVWPEFIWPASNWLAASALKSTSCGL